MLRRLSIERVSVARDKLTATVLDNSQRPEAVIFQFEHPFWVIERQRSARQRHGLACHRRENSSMKGENGANSREVSLHLYIAIGIFIVKSAPIPETLYGKGALSMPS